ncbi:hypothetical protein DFH07DRAFT_962522 [Mycena maculata]|uniref:Uncharacterized protein n=1 Tax=Mycena maculata TaxID=230809 RepID=A0AAD7N644_9AGAR|nr:hypothetical protein DFH07DRAFT_962522 [Mycena maculata]
MSGYAAITFFLSVSAAREKDAYVTHQPPSTLSEFLTPSELSKQALHHAPWLVTWLDNPNLDPDQDTIWYGFGDDVIEDGVRYRDPKIKPEPMDVDVSEVSGSVAEGKRKEKESTVGQTEASGSGLTSAEKGKGKAVESESEEEEEEVQEEGSEWGGIPPEDL